jgi:hypothetical protein
LLGGGWLAMVCGGYLARGGYFVVAFSWWLFRGGFRGTFPQNVT